MKQISTKQSVINRKLYKVYEEIDNEREPICEGCGSSKNLSHSHLISKADCKGYGIPELIYDKRNIRLHCMNGCHEKWESRDCKTILEMNDGAENILFVKQNNEILYQKIMR